MRSGSKKYINTLLYFVIVLFSACSLQKNYQITSFFFDGVPNPNSVVVEVVLDSLAFAKDSLLLVKKPKKLDFTLHQPYKERACIECHDRGAMGQPKMPTPALCNQCHQDMESQYAYLHGPVAAGNCTQCHNPHKAKFEKLLSVEGQGLCYECHTEEDVKGNGIHSEIGEQNCITCHNPHGGESRLALQKNACFKCHDNFIENKAFVHGPIGAGLCVTCHQSHTSNTPNLLVQSGDQLCLNCHNKQGIETKVYHTAINTSTCVSCHDPHASNQPFLLTQTSKQ